MRGSEEEEVPFLYTGPLSGVWTRAKSGTVMVTLPLKHSEGQSGFIQICFFLGWRCTVGLSCQHCCTPAFLPWLIWP